MGIESELFKKALSNKQDAEKIKAEKQGFGTDKPNRRTGFKKRELIQSKRVNITADPLLTNPLNSGTKLQISAT